MPTNYAYQLTAPYVDDDITLRASWRVLVRRRILSLGRGDTAAVRVRL